MRSLLLGLVVVVAACGSDVPAGTFMLKPDTHMVVVGQYTFVTAYFDDGSPDPPAVVADWSVDMPGIITLTPTVNIQKVTGVAVGQVVVTAVAYEQTAKTGFTVVAP
jgi:hypothetical protein